MIRELIAELRDTRLHSGLHQGWAEAVEAWLDSKARRSCGANTVKAYRIALRQFLEWSDVPLWDVDAALAERWARWLGAEGKVVRSNGQVTRGPLSAASVNQKLAALTSFYSFVRERYPDLWPAERGNPFAGVGRARVSPYGRARYPSVDELQAIFGEIDTGSLAGKRDFALLYTIAVTCRRASEILNLRWGDLEVTHGGVIFQYRYKGGDTRHAVLPKLCYQAIRVYLRAAGRLESMRDEDYVFAPLDPDRIRRLRPTADVDPNRPIANSTANAILRKYARRAGVDEERAHLHGLRHAGARLRARQMKQQGEVDYLELMELLGHSSLAVTQIYSQEVLEAPRDRGGDAAAAALMPEGRSSRAGSQGR